MRLLIKIAKVLYLHKHYYNEQDKTKISTLASVETRGGQQISLN